MLPKERFPPSLPRIPPSARRHLAVVTVGGIGAGTLAFHLAHAVTQLRAAFVAVLFGVLFPILLSVLLLVTAFWLARSRLAPEYVLRVAGWCVLGTLVLASTGVLIILYQQAEGVVMADRGYLVVNTGTWGAAIGVLVGIYDTEIKLRTRELADQKGRFEFLNQLLRHEVLNRMNLVLAKADELAGAVGPEEEERVETVMEQGQEIVTLIQRVRILTDPEAREATETLDLGAVLERELAQARSAYTSASFTVEDDVSGIEVRADELLSEVFQNLFQNAVRHNDAEEPRVRVTVENGDGTARVRVSDNGSGIPNERKEAVFDRREKDVGSSGAGLGLYIVDMLVSSYGGDVRVEDAPDGGASFTVELPTA